MSAYAQRWQVLADRVDALTLRERALIFLAIAIALVVLVNLFLIDPLLTRNKNLQQRIVQEEQETSVMQTQINSMILASSTDPDAALKTRLAELRAQSQHSAETLEDIQSGLVPPQRIPALLQDLLRQNRSVTLVSMKTLPVETLTVPAAPAANAAPVTAGQPPPAPVNLVYKHGVEITVQGSYLDLLHYLNSIEGLPWHMLWGTADVDGEKYPTVTLTLRLYTLSLDEAWLTL